MIGLIVARSKNNVIGKNGNIPWKIKGEQKQFRELTTGNVVINSRLQTFQNSLIWKNYIHIFLKYGKALRKCLNGYLMMN